MDTTEGRAADGQRWQEGWRCADRPGNSSWQSNGCDCGIFVLTSMSLVCNGLPLSKEVYTQGTLTLQRTRKGPAKRIWVAGINNEATRWAPQLGVGALPARAPPAGWAAGGSSCSRKRGNGCEGRLVLGSKKLRRWWRCCEDGQRDKGESQGNKRSAKSETEEEEGSDKTRVRIFQPPEKRARSITVGH